MAENGVLDVSDAAQAARMRQAAAISAVRQAWPGEGRMELVNPATIASLTTAAGTLAGCRDVQRDPLGQPGVQDRRAVAAGHAPAGPRPCQLGDARQNSGIALLQAWYPTPERILGPQQHPPVEDFRALTRALYVPPGGLGFWQGALRDPSDQVFADFAKAADSREPVTIDVLYSDMNGGQRTITRLSVLPVRQDLRAAADDPQRPTRWVVSSARTGCSTNQPRADRLGGNRGMAAWGS